MAPLAGTVASATPRPRAPEPGKRFRDRRWVNDCGVVIVGEFAALSATIEMTVAFDAVVTTSGDGVTVAAAGAEPLTAELVATTGFATLP